MQLLTSILFSFLAFIIVLSVVVVVHELGHYLLAIASGVKVEAFSIGFGKELFGRTDKRGTRWKVCLLPFGGYVEMFCDKDVSSSSLDKEKLEQLTEEEKNGILQLKPLKNRMLVAAAGPVFNFIFAIIILTFIYSTLGIATFAPKITDIQENSPASRANVQVGDVVLSVNNHTIKKFEDIQMQILLTPKEPIVLELKRGEETIQTILTADYKETPEGEKAPYIGIGSNEMTHHHLNIFMALKESIKSVYNVCSTTLIALGQMLVGARGLDDLGGPVKIAKYSGISMSNGFFSLLSFMALISTSLGLMNLLPIPGLDGGHLFFYFIELLREKPLDEKVQNALLQSGFYLLITLMLFATIKDILQVF